MQIKGRESEKTLEKNLWTEEAIEFCHKQCENWNSMEEETNKLWEEIRKVKSSMLKREIKIEKWGLGKKEWHSNEWKVRKREVRRSLRQFKKAKTRRCGATKRRRNMPQKRN